MHAPETTNHRSFRAKKGSGYLASPNEIMSAMIKAVKYMVNVTAYDFWWRDPPLNHDTLAFLASAGVAFNRSLSKLVLHAGISKFESFVTLTNSLARITFQFRFRGQRGRRRARRSDSRQLHCSIHKPPHIPPIFDNNVVGQTGPSSISPCLGIYPNTSTSGASHSLQQKHLSDPSSISHILHLHETFVSSVELSPNDEYTPKDPSYPDMTLYNWSAVARRCLVNTGWLGNVESLTILALHHPSTLTMIHHTSAHLTSLCLFNR
ncbi:hypothetical protein FPV67DRAFT_570429 [Lyophyllum atratum]|nr:hypothetical protein FPV67DRAFT_570429 [Lyophyllum atratum]